MASFISLPVSFAEIASRVSPRSAFMSLPEIEALRAKLAERPRTLLAAETLAYFVVLTEFAIRDPDSRARYKTSRSKFYNLQRRKVAFEDPMAMHLAIQLRQQHTVQGVRKLQTQLFTAYPVAAGLTDVQSIRATDERDFAVMPTDHWEELLSLLVVIYPDQITKKRRGEPRRIEPRTKEEVTDLLRKRLIRFAGRTPQSMARAIERSIGLFNDARRIYRTQRKQEQQSAKAT